MRPLRLTMTAFGPYAGCEVVDFEALADLGLFVVAGGNGSGKSTIFDALYFALYGSLPGRRSSYQQLRSDHAAPGIECSVVLDFAAKGSHWRVERLPRQQRPKRRGDGMVYERQRATLSRLDGSVATTELNRPNEVNERCVELIGLAGNQFERVALLPQGEFSRMLRDPTAERRKLLSALFASDVFGDTSRALTVDATAVTTAETAVQTQHTEQLASLAARVGEATGKELPPEIDALQAALRSHETESLAPLKVRATMLGEQATAATTAHERARLVVARAERRAQIRTELETHREQLPVQQRDRARLERGRASVPVVDVARVAGRQNQARATAERDLAAAHKALDEALSAVLPEQAPLALSTNEAARIARDELHDLIEEVSTTAKAVVAAEQLATSVRSLEKDSTRLRTKEELVQSQHATARAKRRANADTLAQLQTTGDVAELDRQLERARTMAAQRHELDAIRAAEDAAQRAVHAAEAALAESAAFIDVVEQAERAQASLNAAAQRDCETLAELQRRRDAFAQWQVASERLAHARVEHTKRLQRHAELFDALLQGSSARLAESLVDDCPCPVCGSLAHPSPATASDVSITEEQVTDARERSDRASALRQQLELELSALHQRDADLGELKESEINEQIRAATANALATENAAAENQQHAVAGDEARRIHSERHVELQRCINKLQPIIDRRNHATGALGTHASRSLEDVDEAVQLAEHALEQAQTAAARVTTIDAENAQLEMQIENLEIAVLSLSNERSALDAQIAQQQVAHREAVETVESLRRNLNSPAARSDLSPDVVLDALRTGVERIEAVDRVLTERASALRASERAQLMLTEKLAASMFDRLEDAQDAFVDPETIAVLEAATSAYTATHDRLVGQLREFNDLPTDMPNLDALAAAEHEATQAAQVAHRSFVELESLNTHLGTEITQLEAAIAERADDEAHAQRAARVAAMVSGKNHINTSLEDWVLAAHLRDVVELANLRLAKSTQQRFQLCVLDEGTTRRGSWGLDLAVVDSVTGTQRPTAGLSGGELFQASLALALGLADVVMNQSAGVHIDALFIDEGFGALDETSVERAIDLLDELRGRGAMVGVITHVPALLEALPRGITVVASSTGDGSQIEQHRLAA